MASEQHEGYFILKTEFNGTLVFSREPSGRLRHFAQHEIPVQEEDAGQSWIAEFGLASDTGMFVRLHSWDPECVHDQMQAFVNKRVRITVEVMDLSQACDKTMVDS